jgi:hypothetical protein
MRPCVSLLRRLRFARDRCTRARPPPPDQSLPSSGMRAVRAHRRMGTPARPGTGNGRARVPILLLVAALPLWILQPSHMRAVRALRDRRVAFGCGYAAPLQDLHDNNFPQAPAPRWGKVRADEN